MEENGMNPGRRKFIQQALLGPGLLSLRSLATGIPASLLLAPRTARAQGTERAFLVFVSSAAGDPINANVPGTYGDARVAHPVDARLAPTQFQLGGVLTTAAKVWADLPAAILNRTSFFHHATLNNAHPNHPKVMSVMGRLRRNEMLISYLSKETALEAKTTQKEPVSLRVSGSELLSFEGRTLAHIAPTALRDSLGTSDGPLTDLRGLRDREIDRMYSIYKRYGTKAQKSVLDRFAQTRNEARGVSDVLIDQLSAIRDNGGTGQIVAAPLLLAMNLTPAVAINIPFGGDNHVDTNLQQEANQTVSGVNQIKTLVEKLDSFRSQGALTRPYVVVTLNVFGRTLEKKGTTGRDHNKDHHVAVMIGDGVRPGIVGGIERKAGDWGATGIDSQTGGISGGIPYVDTFAAMAKTLGALVGVPRDSLEENISGGKVVESVLA
jgi:hypothetical protein